MHKRHLYAFTLVELMIAIAIIAILSGSMLPSFMRARDEANIAACSSNLNTISKAMETLAIRNPQFVNTHRDSVIDNHHPLVEMGYLKHAPKCPKCGCYYKYCQNKVGTTGVHYWIEHNNSISHSGKSADKGFPIYDSKCGLVRDRDHWNTLFDKNG